MYKRDTSGDGSAWPTLSQLVSRFTIAALAVTAVACSTPPRRSSMPIATPVGEQNEAPAGESQLGDEIALRAISQVGKPYLYGGADLQGFDCSGLVFYVHRDLGIQVPRTAAEQYAASKPVNVHGLEPGDLLFFRTTRSKRITHVGIYAGGGRFVHAPQTGRTIELRYLDDEYYSPRLVGAGRFYDDRG